LGHYYREGSTNSFLKDIKENFSVGTQDIYLISANYSPHLLTMAHTLIAEGFPIKGWKIKESYAQCMDKALAICLCPLSINLKEPLEQNILVLPEKGIIFVSDHRITFPQ